VHDIQAKWTRECKVKGRIGLFHEARLLSARLDSEPDGQRSQEPLHDEFSSKRQHDSVKGDKGKVLCTLAVLCGLIWAGFCIWRQRIRQEYGWIDGIFLGRIAGVGEQDDEAHDQRIEPGVPQ
jgi:hypothetical protein